jgi:hypothetical protein
VFPGAIERARQLGANVADQVGRSYAEVQYRGDPGLCPLCHLNVVDIHGTDVECATCGAAGRLEVADGVPRVVFDPAGLDASVISMAEKRAHAAEILETAAAHAQRAEEVAAGSASFAAWYPPITPPVRQ